MGKGKEASREQMIKRLFDMLLLLVNSVGIVGALMEILEVPWSDMRDRILFWGILFLFCAFSVEIWQGADGGRLIRRGCICALIYVGLAAYFRKTLFGGLFLAMRNAAATLDERYQFHIAWPDGLAMLREAGWEGGSEIWIITAGVLFLLFPLVLLAGLLLVHSGCFWLFPGNGLWLVAACACDRFPDIFFLIFCVLGAAALLVYKEFEANSGVGICAVAIVAVLAGFGAVLIYRFVLPIADLKYEEGQEDRRRFYDLVNEEWIPGIRRMLSGYGIGSGTDVTGAFNRQSLFAYTTEDVYRVTMDSVPADVLYLKGYVGATYGKKEWLPRSDRELETYYEEHGLELPEDFGWLANISYMSVQSLQEHIPAGSIRIEELGGRGSYSIYPYGAWLTADYLVHGDGSVERRDREYDFPYRSLSEILIAGPLPEPWRTAEEQYRQYVYDSFLEYPKELELYAKHLERENVRTGNIEQCVSDIMGFLKRQASYNLDAGKNPSGEDFVEYFLFDSHEGYCVHFASAAVLALRYFGIPARYVTGYVVVPSDFSEDGDGAYSAVVTGKQAHAWAEIYLDGKGWLPVEATPGAAAFPGGNDMGLMAGWEGQGFLTVDSWIRDTSAYGSEPPDEGETPGSLESAFPGGSGALEGLELELSGGGEASEDPEPGYSDSLAKQEMWGSEDALGEPGESEGVASGEMSGEGNGTGGSGEGAAEGWAASDSGMEESTGMRVLERLAPIMAGLVSLAAIGLLGKYLHGRGNRRWHNALQEAEAGRRVLLLYRNMRRVLRMAGCPERLDADEEAFWQAFRKALPGMKRAEYESFCTILEKASFGNAEPSEEELCAVLGLHDRLVEEVYGKAPFYKKPLFGVVGCYKG